MGANPTRRTVLRTALAGAAGAVLYPCTMPAALAGDPAISADALGGGLHLITGAGCNVVALTAPDGVVMVDGGYARNASALLERVAELPGGGPVAALFNTHWHPAHTGANVELGRAGAEILAHENTRLWLSRPVYLEWRDSRHESLPAEGLPARTFRDDGSVEVGGVNVDHGHLLQAHTDGDIWVRFPEHDVLVVGDTLTVGRYPVSDYTTGGWIGGMLDATRRLLELAEAGTRVVPGQGPVQGRDALEAQYEMLDTVFARMVRMMQDGLSAREMVAAGVTDGFDERWGDPALFVDNGYRGMWGHIREFESGIV